MFVFVLKHFLDTPKNVTVASAFGSNVEASCFPFFRNMFSRLAAAVRRDCQPRPQHSRALRDACRDSLTCSFSNPEGRAMDGTAGISRNSI